MGSFQVWLGQSLKDLFKGNRVVQTRVRSLTGCIRVFPWLLSTVGFLEHGSFFSGEVKNSIVVTLLES